jgi:hypothetical protein
MIASAATDSIRTLEEQVIASFLADPSARLFQRDKVVGQYFYNEFSASRVDAKKNLIFGHGQSSSAHTALLKSICENLERQFMIDYFAETPVDSFSADEAYRYPVLRTSNGWAIHTTEQGAVHSAKCEALERHILILAYLKDGWRAFTKINEMEIGDTTFTSLLCRFTCNDVGVGMVIAKSKRCAGVTFGYFSDAASGLRTSAKWLHALYEAKGQLDGHADISNLSKERCVVKDAIIDHLHSDWIEPEFSMNEKLVSLPSVWPTIERHLFKLNDSISLHVANVRDGGLVPLFFLSDLTSQARKYLEKQLSAFGTSIGSHSRIPIL